MDKRLENANREVFLLHKRTLLALLVVAGAAPAAALAEPIGPKEVNFAGLQIEQSLTGKPGDPEQGAEVLADRKLGNCLACHQNGAMPKQQFQGNVGPSLDGVASRYSEPTLRAIVVDAKKVFGEQTVMPGFYSLDVGVNVRDDLKGKTILTAQQVENVVAYLSTLKE